MEVRHRLGGRHADPEVAAADARRARRQSLAHRRRWSTRGGAARSGRALPARPVAQPARLPEGRAPARRQSDRLLALGADREGPRRQRGRARTRARRRHHHVRQVPRRRHDQLAPSDPAPQDHDQPTGAGRLQHRARVDQPDRHRRGEVAHGLALASWLGRQLAVLPPEHRAQRLRRPVPRREGQRLPRGHRGAAVGRERHVSGDATGHRRQNGRRRLSPGRRSGEQLPGGVRPLRRRVRGAG